MKLYILKLSDNKYYIGKTNDVPQRVQQHFLGKGSKWTSQHKPIKLERTIENIDEFDEDKWVKIYMKKHGIDNVRGGTYSSIDLHFTIKHFLQTELDHSENKCFICDRYGHLSVDCVKNKTSKLVNTNNNFCSNCGIRGHTIKNCFYKTTYEKACELCGKDGHHAHECFKRFK